MRLLLAAVIVIAGAWGIGGAIISQADHVPACGAHSVDVNGDGYVNSGDLGCVAAHFGQTFAENPCVEYVVVHDDTMPTQTIQNTLGEIITPQRGGSYILPYGHPQWDVAARGDPPDLWACPR